MSCENLQSAQHRWTANQPNAAFRAYFYSGWAFFIPYLAVYLLYAWLRWPVNLSTSGSLVPPLLHVYWLLHVIHVGLGTIALTSYWRSQREAGLRVSGILWPAIPWLLLGLLFYIPGIYLEWPSDPWEHLRRINEWHMQSTVTAHSTWLKSSYFLPYSLTGFTTGATQLSWLNVYYTAICLLLSWQYYLLGRVVGLNERASFVFVLLNTVTFGNSIFSFYRYYGLSSTIVSQIAAMALVRLGIASIQSTFNEKSQLTTRPAKYRPLCRSILSAAILAILMAFSHVQGLGISGLGLSAVAVWRLLKWRRVTFLYLLLAFGALSVAAFVWYPRNPMVDTDYRQQGWLNWWYGFSLLSQTAANTRVTAIFGLLGWINVVVGLMLLLRNHLVGWLTLMPILALQFPFLAIPIADALANVPQQIPGQYIITFHRLLFSVPAGLALATAFDCSCSTYSRYRDRLPRLLLRLNYESQKFRTVAIGTAGALLLTILVPPNDPHFNRLFSALCQTPDDLRISYAFAIFKTSTPQIASLHPTFPLIANGGISFTLQATGEQNLPTSRRMIYWPAPLRNNSARDALIEHTRAQTDGTLLVPSERDLYTPKSLMGTLSGHWLPNEVALDYSGAPELAILAKQLGLREIQEPRSRLFRFPAR